MARKQHISKSSAFYTKYGCKYVGATATLLSDGHGRGFPDATVGSCDHEGAASHGHVQVLLHKPLGSRQEGIPASRERLLLFYSFLIFIVPFRLSVERQPLNPTSWDVM